MKRLLFLFLTLSFLGQAQDFHYSQLDQSLTLINPATTSTFSGFERITLQHRNQWLGAGTQFMTSMGMAEFSIGKIARQKSAYAGIGVYFVNDVGGDSKFSIKSGGVTASGVLPIAKNHTISAGIHAAFTNRSADFSRVSFMNQWNGSEFDNSIDPGESNGISSFSHLDAGVGIAYGFNKENENTLSSNEMSFQGGVSVQHLNKPKLRYNSLVDDRLFMKFCFHANARYGLSSESNLEVSAAQFIQGKHLETMVGLFYRLKTKNASRVTSILSNQYFVFGTYFRSVGTVIPTIYFDLGVFSLGLSYDYEFGQLSSMYKQSVEVSLKFNSGKKSIFNSSKLR
ncbi:PorP/SprF family type IX secretion system membrane protein [Crocinitomicaceae bacterium]|nr:PorP/SprF family type IX secretion system membrane protein [Crocinitomicaceae bacterium]